MSFSYRHATAFLWNSNVTVCVGYNGTLSDYNLHPIFFKFRTLTVTGHHGQTRQPNEFIWFFRKESFDFLIFYFFNNIHYSLDVVSACVCCQRSTWPAVIPTPGAVVSPPHSCLKTRPTDIDDLLQGHSVDQGTLSYCIFL